MVKMTNNDEKLYHKFLVLLDNELTEKLYNHAEELRHETLCCHPS